MKVWIFVAILAWSVSTHNHIVMAINAQPKPTIQMHGPVEGGLANNVKAPLPFFIVGQNNLCLVANRNLPNLVDCNKDEITQKWNLYADGSIRTQQNSNCLTANNLTKGSGILILPCSPDLSDYQIWQIKEADQSIKNLQSGLLLDVAKVDIPQLIILWSPNGDRSQRWRLIPFSLMANNAQPKPTIQMYGCAEGGPANNYRATLPFFIVGLNDLCLVANRNLANLMECKSDEKKQHWNLYTDGSIRTQQNNNNCLTANDLTKGSSVLILPCSPDLSENQIWQIMEADQAIMNLHSGLVLDVAKLDSPQLIILWSPHAEKNQRWRLKLCSLAQSLP
ncbi:hypothetical protein POTOM_040510 [Populus tomentosa]|uniref:Ricin B lectin domain-containing protein n=1 Tax=Populus tomentosa TaxID=118781 RepID=A0A8X8CAC5_POPTO|nr:hypothetical protein POTOM_040510 [Populus tomentosa]